MISTAMWIEGQGSLSNRKDSGIRAPSFIRMVPVLIVSANGVSFTVVARPHRSASGAHLSSGPRSFCGHAPWPAGSLPDGFLGALQFRHLPDAQNQRVAVVGQRPQVEDGVCRFASDNKLLATWCGDLKLAGLVEQSLGEIVGSDRLI